MRRVVELTIEEVTRLVTEHLERLGLDAGEISFNDRSADAFARVVVKSTKAAPVQFVQLGPYR